MNKWIIRPEREQDYTPVERITRAAFWNLFPGREGCNEHLLVHKLRKADAFLPSLDFVAEQEEEIVGNIMYSKAIVKNESGACTEVLMLGPLTVHPDCQRKGIGTSLMKHSLAAAAAEGHRAVLLYGHVEYYPRFGFVPAEAHKISTPDGGYIDALMALELYDGALCGVSGRLLEDPVFETLGAEELADFDRLFA